jgi:sirohydrochlorin cobaltochelatase
LGNCDIKGLGDYSKIVSVWVSHIEKKIADNDAMYDPDAEEE